jgi:hypothetical protein
MLKGTERNKGAKGNPGGQGAKIVRSQNGTTQTQPTLSDLNLSKKKSAVEHRLFRQNKSIENLRTVSSDNLAAPRGWYTIDRAGHGRSVAVGGLAGRLLLPKKPFQAAAPG